MALLDKDRIIAPPGFNRWLVPPAALAIHLSIGMAYGFSVFWLPLSRAYGWSIPMLGWIYTLFFVFLGLSAAVFGRWVERAGPRKAGVVAACCWSGGLALSALGIYWHQLWLLWLGSGVLGGIGLGLGYISPVSTLIQWFPDRRGLATGLAIMGFGGGAMIGAPLATLFMQHFATESTVGVWETFLALAGIYFVAMMAGAFGYRLPPAGWTPDGRVLGAASASNAEYVSVTVVHRTPQFWLLWVVLCLNVAAGIGVIGMASPMLQEIFGGRLLGSDAPLSSMSEEDRRRVASIAAGFAGLLSLFNIAGRIFWASLSDPLGRKTTYAIFFLIGAALYAAIPSAGAAGRVLLFVAILGAILTMYGGGFATIPAYLADLFGPRQISAIHGRLLTAWSVAGILGPVVVNNLREWRLRDGVPAAQTYDDAMYLLGALLIVGGICNWCITPVRREFFVRPEVPTIDDPAVATSEEVADPAPANAWLFFAWLAVGLPVAWGVWVTLARFVALAT